MSDDLSPDSPTMKRIFGAFYGQLIGDALGCRYEFEDTTRVRALMAKDRTADGFLPILGGGPFNLRPGQVTDDSEMALSLARSLAANGRFEKYDVACSYAYWVQTNPPDIGITTNKALSIPQKLTKCWRTDLPSDEKLRIYNRIHENIQERCIGSMSNGSLMRISPLAIAYRKDLKALHEFAVEDAGLTHCDVVVFDAVRVYVTAIALLLNGHEPPVSFAPRNHKFQNVFAEVSKLAQTDVIKGHLEDAKTLPIPVRLPKTPIEYTNGDTKCIGYLGVALQSAFYELLYAESFQKGVEEAIARGGDTDTNGCIVAALLGARFGVDNIPDRWIKSVREAVPRSDELEFVSMKDVDTFVPSLANLSSE